MAGEGGTWGAPPGHLSLYLPHPPSQPPKLFKFFSATLNPEVLREEDLGNLSTAVHMHPILPELVCVCTS